MKNANSVKQEKESQDNLREASGLAPRSVTWYSYVDLYEELPLNEIYLVGSYNGSLTGEIVKIELGYKF